MPDTASSSAGALYLYEVLYRGRAPGDATPPDYHVILAHDATDAFGRKSTAFSDAMTADQAKAAGFDLPAILLSMNTTTMTSNAALATSLADAETKAADLQTRLDAASATNTTLTAKVADLEAELAEPEVQDRIAKMRAAAAAPVKVE